MAATLSRLAKSVKLKGPGGWTDAFLEAALKRCGKHHTRWSAQWASA